MDNNLSVFNHKRFIKTYPPSKAKVNNKLNAKKAVEVDVETREPLTTRNAVRLLLQGTLKSDVCRYCLHVASHLSELDQIMQVASQGTLFKVTIRDMLASFHPIKVVDDPNFPNKICDKCLDSTLKAYLFSQQCERAERALRNCFDDMYEKINKLDPIEGPAKRGRRKLNPNYNVLYTEHEKVMNYAEPIINLINTSSETLEPESPVTSLECMKCCLILPNPESLLNHEKLHPTSMWYNCRMCGKSFPKRSQIKKHLQMHWFNQPNKNVDNTFICKNCSHVNENSMEFLQHVEKHKFKEVMEHLLDRRMHMLCAVCMNKEPKMVDIDTMISLNGGHPSLSGQKNLYSILASTLPDPKSYKYQELIIPREATIIKLVKKSEYQMPKDTTEKTIKEFNFISPIVINNSNRAYTGDMYTFVISKPDDIENNTNTISETYQENTLDVCLKTAEIRDDINDTFVFSWPNNIENLIKNTSNENDKQSKINVVEGNVEIDVNKYKSKIYGGIAQKNFENNNIDENVKYNMTKKIDQTVKKLCEICWIFNKPSCIACIEKDKFNATSKSSYKPELIGINTDYFDQKESCKYCWLFKNVPKCDFCKEPTSKNGVANKSIHNKKLIIDYSLNNEPTYNVVEIKHTNITNLENQSDFCKESTSKIGVANKSIHNKKLIIDYSLNNEPTNNDVEIKHTNITNVENQSDFCKKSTLNINNATENILHHDSQNKYTEKEEKINYNKITTIDKQEDLKENTSPSSSLKRTVDKNTWQCPICLIDNNYNIENCHCCDSKRFKGDTINVKLGDYRHQFSNNSKANNSDHNKDIHTTELKQEAINNDIEKIGNSNNVEPMDIEMIKETEIITNQIDTTNNDFIITDKSEHFQIEYIDLNTNIDNEKMDIAEDINVTVNYQDKPEFHDVLTHYEFNIGTTSPVERKFKRAKRKLQRASK